MRAASAALSKLRAEQAHTAVFEQAPNQEDRPSCSYRFKPIKRLSHVAAQSRKSEQRLLGARLGHTGSLIPGAIRNLK